MISPQARHKLAQDPIALVSLFIIVFYILISLLAFFGVIAGNYNITNNDNTYAFPDSTFWLGTDVFGRSVLDRAIHGCLTALTVGFFAATLSVTIGSVFGSMAGYFGGWVDRFVTWLYSTLDSIPYILLLASFALALGQGLTNVFLALGLTGWVSTCRLVRAEVLKQKQLDYVLSARALGFSKWRILFGHIFPNTFHIVIIQFSLRFVSAIKIEVILSYLGLGVEPGTASWGMMIDDAKSEMIHGIWWNLLAATGFMFVLVLAVNLLSDSLRQALDPKIKV